MENSHYQYEKISVAIQYISENWQAQPTLEEVAEKVFMSPFHFQRVFSEWAGVSPKRFLQFLTTDYLKQTLKRTSSLLEAAETAGLSSQSRVYDLFTGIEAVTPQQFKTGGQGLQIVYGYHDTPFGECFIAVTSRGICGMAFIDPVTRGPELERFRLKWNFAAMSEDAGLTEQYVQSIFRPQAGPVDKLHLLVQGTNFQLKVWEALLTIPESALTTYQQIAGAIGHPKAVRAVGTAVGGNPIAYLIPCHRVIRKEGLLGEYRWGSIRKKALVGWEAALREEALKVL